MMSKTKAKKIPLPVYNRVGSIGKLFGVPTTKAFMIQDKFLMGDFKAKRIKKRKNKNANVFELEFDI